MSPPPDPPENLEAASSAELIRRVHGGEERAFGVLHDRYRPALERWASGRLPRGARDLVDTEDMVQEALIGTVRNLRNFEPRGAGAFLAYVRQALHNRIRDEVRRSRSRPRRAEMPADHPDDGDSPLESVIGREAVERYERALAQLSETDREMVLARVELGLAYREIAEATGRPSADAVRMAVARALVRLAEEMSRE